MKNGHNVNKRYTRYTEVNESYNDRYNSAAIGVSEIYNALSDLAFDFHENGNDLTKAEFENAFAFFLDKFFEDEGYEDEYDDIDDDF